MKIAESGWKKHLEDEIGRAGKVFVLGIGNSMRGDDGAGSLCSEDLAERLAPEMESVFRSVTAHDVPENFTGVIRSFGPDLVVVVDAVLAGEKPGSIVLVDKMDIKDEGLSTHRVPLSRFADYLEKTVGCRVVFVCIQPDGLEFGAPMTKAVRGAALQISRFLAETASARFSTKP